MDESAMYSTEDGEVMEATFLVEEGLGQVVYPETVDRRML